MVIFKPKMTLMLLFIIKLQYYNRFFENSYQVIEVHISDSDSVSMSHKDICFKPKILLSPEVKVELSILAIITSRVLTKQCWPSTGPGSSWLMTQEPEHTSGSDEVLKGNIFGDQLSFNFESERS